MPSTILISLKEEWQEAWQNAVFRRKLFTGLLSAIVIMAIFPFFFQTIEKRAGYHMVDPLLSWLPPHNVSSALFVVIWSITLLVIVRTARNPIIFLSFLWCWVLLSVMRMLTITLVPLEPPVGLIRLADPFSNFFYGAGDRFVTKDLFFSGHTSTIFLYVFCLHGRTDKAVALIATALVGSLLLVQHVHYTLDVLGGLFFARIAYGIVKKWILPPVHSSSSMNS